MWISVFVLIVIIGAYAALHSKKNLITPIEPTTPAPTASPTTPPTGTKKPVSTKPTTPVPGAPAVSQNVHTITQKDWGIAFTKSAGWEINIQPLSNKIFLADTTGEGKGDTILIEYIMGDRISDADVKFGDITYYYEKSTGRWLEIDTVSGKGANLNTTPVPARIVAYTADKLPVYPGTKRWLTYIVPLSTNTFLKLNITGSGATAALQELVKTIRKI